MKRTILAVAAASLLLVGCGSDEPEPVEANSPSTPTSAPESEPAVTLGSACDTFSSSSDDADALAEVGESLDDPISEAFADMAAAVRAQDGATGLDLLDARAAARDAAAQIDAVC